MKNSILKRLLSLLLCLAMFLSLGVSSFAEAPEEDGQDKEPAESITPEEESAEGVDLPASTRDGESVASYTLSGPESIIVRDDSRIRVTVTLEELSLGAVLLDGGSTSEKQAVGVVFQFSGYYLEDGNGHELYYKVSDSADGQPQQNVATQQYAPENVPTDFSVYMCFDEDEWFLTVPGVYEGYLMCIGYWIFEDGSSQYCTIEEAFFIPITAYVPDDLSPHTVTLPTSNMGTITANGLSVYHGVTVTLTATPALGCELKSISAVDSTGLPVELTDIGGGKYTFVMPSFDVTVYAEWEASWAGLQQRIDAASNGATIKLDYDFTAKATDTALVIPAGKALILDLNDHTLDRNLTAPTANGNAITNNGTLTIRDSGGNEDGRITGANNSGSGGAVANYGTLTVEDGSFTGNTAKEAGAVYNASGAVLTITNCNIDSNTATTWGGGGVVNYGTMTLIDGYITNNTAKGNGGGIWTAGTLTVTGGAVSYNTLTSSTSNGGGVYFKQGTFNISESVFFYGNTVEMGDGEARTNNVHLLPGNKLTVTSELLDYAYIGVTSEETQLPIVITSGFCGNGSSDVFHSDDNTRRVSLNAAGEIILKENKYELWIDSQMTGGTVVADKTKYDPYENIFLTVTPDEGMKLSKLYYTVAEYPGEETRITETDEQGRYTTYMPLMDVTVHAVFVPDVEEYNLWVGDTRVSVANKDNILGDSGTPKATYDPETHTLTLRSPSIRGGDDTRSLIYAMEQDLIIVAETPLSLTASSSVYNAIRVDTGNLTLRGTISAISDYDHAIRVEGYNGVGGNILIEGDLTAGCTEIPFYGSSPYGSINFDAIHVDGTITLAEGGSLKAKGMRNALYSDDDEEIRLLGSSVELEGRQEAIDSYGRLVLDCDAVITGHDDRAIRCGDLLVRGGTITVSCDADSSKGIYASGSMTMEGGTLTATGTRRGIEVSGTLTVKREITRLTAQCDSGKAIKAWDGIILDYIIVQEPAGAVLSEDSEEFVAGPGSEEEVTRVVLVPDPNAPKLYHVTVDGSVPDGLVTADKTEAEEGETVTLTVSDLGSAKLFAEFINYKLQPEEVYDLQQVSENTWTFTMPYADVTVSLRFKAEAVFPAGLTGVRILSIYTGSDMEEGNVTVYASPGEEVSVSFRLLPYYEPETLTWSYWANGVEIVENIQAEYNENTGNYTGSFTMPAAAVTVTTKAGTAHPWKALQAQIDEAYDGQGIVLAQNTTAEADDTALDIPAGKSITLDLNGFTLDRGLAEGSAASGGSVLTVHGGLTIQDNSAEQTGLITGGNTTGSGGGINNLGSLTIDGGRISGNVSEAWGGGVYLAQESTLNLNGGIIKGNRCVNNGGGIHVSERAVLNVSGAPEIFYNIKGETINNVNLANGARIHVTGQLTEARIGVSSSNAPVWTVPVVFTEGLDGRGTAEDFFSDNENYYVRVINGEAYLAMRLPVAVDPPEHGMVGTDREYAGPGEIVTVYIFPDEGYKLVSLGYLTPDGDPVEITADENGIYRFIMPDCMGTVTVFARFGQENYSVAVSGTVEGGAVTADKASAVFGETVTLTVTPNSGMLLKRVYYISAEDGAETEITEQNEDGGYVFAMPAANVTVCAEFEQIRYTITVSEGIQHGSVTADRESAPEGATVTLTVTPEEGYELASLTRVTGDEDHVTEITDKDAEGNYIFTMPAGNVSITASFRLLPVPYIDARGNDMEPAVGCTPVNENTTEMRNGWYVADGIISNPNRIAVSGTVNLILTEGTQLNVAKGVGVNAGNTLIIWQQRGNNPGALIVNQGQVPTERAGIGGNAGDCGTIIINGGSVRATGGLRGAGIGGSYSSFHSAGGSGGSITVNAGTVNAVGGDGAAGLGGGYKGAGGNITINGGSVNAYGTYSSAGIGGGNGGSGGVITITGGNIMAKGADLGAGIGGGGDKGGGMINITGGRILGTGNRSNGRSAIGDSYGYTGDEPGTVTLSWTVESKRSMQVEADGYYVGNVILEKSFRNLENEEEIFYPGDYSNSPAIDKKTIVPADPSFTIAVSDQIRGGTVTVQATAHEGDRVVLTEVVPDDGFRIGEPADMYWEDENGNRGEIHLDADEYWFEMPAGNVTVYVKFIIPVWVGSVQVDPDNWDDVLGDGTVHYDLSSGTLTFDRADVALTGLKDGHMIYAGQGLTISAPNGLTLDYDGAHTGPFVEDGGLTLNAQGPVKVRSSLYAIYSGKDAVINADVDAASAAYHAIYVSDGSLTVNGALNAAASGSSFSLFARTDMTLTGGPFTLQGAIQASTGSFAATGNLSVTGGDQFCIATGQDMTITGDAELILTSGNMAVNAGGALVLNGGIVTRGGNFGLSAQGDVEIRGGSVETSGSTMGIRAGGKLTISNDVEYVIADSQNAYAIYFAGGLALGDEMELAEPENGVLESKYFTVNGQPAKHVVIRHKAATITVNFDACGGTAEPASLEIQASAAIGELPVPTREGNWVFLGWFTEPAETAFAAGQGTPVTAESTFDEDTTIYAHWRLPGDINGDGVVNNKDLTRLQRYLKGDEVEVVERNLDVNGDGSVNNKDLTRLQKYLKGDEVEIH